MFALHLSSNPLLLSARVEVPPKSFFVICATFARHLDSLGDNVSKLVFKFVLSTFERGIEQVLRHFLAIYILVICATMCRFVCPLDYVGGNKIFVDIRNKDT